MQSFCRKSVLDALMITVFFPGIEGRHVFGMVSSSLRIRGEITVTEASYYNSMIFIGILCMEHWVELKGIQFLGHFLFKLFAHWLQGL
jgi:hypothetical protein